MLQKLFSSLHGINSYAMIPRNKMKLIRSLSRKKFRNEHNLFLVEGEKMVRELLEQGESNGIRVAEIIASGSWIEMFRQKAEAKQIPLFEAGDQEIKSASSLVSPQGVLALVHKPDPAPDMNAMLKQAVLVFDSIRDPGNLGTIIRTADWFGIHHLVCSPDSVDCFNPKVVQATMGAILRVKVHYTELESFLTDPQTRDRQVFGTLLEGQSVYSCDMGKAPVILFGNESRGLSPALKQLAGHAITIPSFSTGGKGSESLNLASSVAVVCSEFRRRE